MATGIVVGVPVLERVTSGTSANNFSQNVYNEVTRPDGILTNVSSQINADSSTIHIFKYGNLAVVNCTLNLNNNASFSADTLLFTLPQKVMPISALYAPVMDADRHVVPGKGVSTTSDGGHVYLRTSSVTTGSIRFYFIAVVA